MRNLQNAIDMIKKYEQFRALAYPDPVSPLYAELKKLYGLGKKELLQDSHMADPITDKFITANPKISGKPWTIGYGYTIGVKYKDTITETEASAIVVKEVNIISRQILDVINERAEMELTDNQLCAIISLAYNTGVGAIKTSTMIKLINERKFRLARDEFKKWNKATVNGVKIELTGLTTRRVDEMILYDRP